MKRSNTRSNIFPLFSAWNFRPVVQCFYGQRYGLCIVNGLPTAKILCSPNHDVEKIKLSLIS